MVDQELLSRIQSEFVFLGETLRDKGFAGRVGFGDRPAVLVVDLVRGFTDPSSPLGHDFSTEVAASAQILSVAHRFGVPVFYSSVSYDSQLLDTGVWSQKIVGNNLLIDGSEWIHPDARLGVNEKDSLVVKRYASCFFGTDLMTRLNNHNIDTLIVTGCTTSGCVRASAVDACSLGLHTIIVGEAVGDRSPISHLASLFDLDMKYADVTSLSKVISYLNDQGS